MGDEEHPLRTTPVPEEIWDVAGVVLGEHPMTLTGWQLDAALQAMSAFGDSMEHMGWALFKHPCAVEKQLQRLKLPAHHVDQRIDRVGILIALCGVPIALRGRDRIAAVRLLAVRGYTSIEIARRLCISNAKSLSSLARRHRIALVTPSIWRSDIDAFCREHRDDATDTEKLVAA